MYMYAFMCTLYIACAVQCSCTWTWTYLLPHSQQPEQPSLQQSTVSPSPLDEDQAVKKNRHLIPLHFRTVINETYGRGFLDDLLVSALYTTVSLKQVNCIT